MGEVDQLREKVVALNELCESSVERMVDVSRRMGELMNEHGDFSERLAWVHKVFREGVVTGSLIRMKRDECFDLWKEVDDGGLNGKVGRVLIRSSEIVGVVQGQYEMICGWANGWGSVGGAKEMREKFSDYDPSIA